MMLPERPNQPGTPKPPPMESGVRLATRALGLGSLYAFGGVGILSALIWFGVGAKNVCFFKFFFFKIFHHNISIQLA